MSRKPYRVVQWATGSVGTTALRHFIDNPAYELAGVFVTSPDKVGRDAGDLAERPATGIIATNDPEAIIALDADCVHFAPQVEDIDVMCRILRSGKNIVSPLGPYYPTPRYAGQIERLEAACQEGGVSFHGSGIHPGFAGDLVPLTFTRLMDRIERIHLYEVVDFLDNPSHYIEFMGFGRDPADLLANPARSADAHLIFSQSMAMVVEGLGKAIEDVTASFEVATATHDIVYPGGMIRSGTVGGQHYEWSAWVDGKPLVTYHCFWTLGRDMEPRWDCGETGYRVVIEGELPLEMSFRGGLLADGRRSYPGWTGLLGVTAIGDVCDAGPGVLSHMDLGIVRPRGLVR
ncbi:NAD(P)H-dependent amine dehydrogenase family protein [Novosphingobium soli]|uniref:2,4-diaminopentanoate dehydrogenase C-terminal domain-containing protein n=1 Tax=Novosphingobium soli TaxID=574956 RepID=A0ABV6CQ99_9SPHN